MDDRKALTGIVFVRKTGPRPTDRSKLGTKRHGVVDLTSVPLSLASGLICFNVLEWLTS